jgi:hypothetical protein
MITLKGEVTGMRSKKKDWMNQDSGKVIVNQLTIPTQFISDFLSMEVEFPEPLALGTKVLITIDKE